MKGMMFTEFIEWVERTWSPDIGDDIIDACSLESDGAYTSVGTYDHREMLALFGALSTRVDEPANVLVKRFGQDAFAILAKSHPKTLVDVNSAFQLLSRLDDHIHPEVRKLYPDAEVPMFEAEQGEDTLTLVYRSSRPFADLAEGLIQGCGAWFGETLVVERMEQQDGSTAFHVRRDVHG